jgi:hypothetical protein
MESIAKELYKRNGGTKTDSPKIRYDDDAIALLDSKWKLHAKVVVISSPTCFQTNRILKPFEKNEQHTNRKEMTFSWNNAYQNLKHDRGNSLHFGSLKYLFDITSALFILNIYYKNETIDLNQDGAATSFPVNMGSELFSIKLHKSCNVGTNIGYRKQSDFDECVYLMKYTDESDKNVREELANVLKRLPEVAINHPKFLQYVTKNMVSIATIPPINNLFDIFSKDEFAEIAKGSLNVGVFSNAKYEAILNKDKDSHPVQMWEQQD